MAKQHSLVFLLLPLLLLFSGCQHLSQSRVKDRVSAMQTLKQLALGCLLYANDHNKMLPSSLTDLKPYISEPFDTDAYELVASGNIEDLGKKQNPSKAILLRQKALLPDGKQIVAFLDGHVEAIQTH